MKFPDVLFNTGKPIVKITFFVGMGRTNSYCEKQGGMSDELYSELDKRLREHITVFSKATRNVLNDFSDKGQKFFRVGDDGALEPD
jgi:hypothetical protein